MAFLIDCCFVKYHSGTPGGENKQTNKPVSLLTFAYKSNCQFSSGRSQKNVNVCINA